MLHSRKLTEEQISDLKKQGYMVSCVNDQDILYAWLNPVSGASQNDYKERQPFRRTEEQAWFDCWCYMQLSVPTVPETDWLVDGNI